MFLWFLTNLRLKKCFSIYMCVHLFVCLYLDYNIFCSMCHVTRKKILQFSLASIIRISRRGRFFDGWICLLKHAILTFSHQYFDEFDELAVYCSLLDFVLLYNFFVELVICLEVKKWSGWFLAIEESRWISITLNSRI